MDRYIAALFLPHTHATEFPSIAGNKYQNFSSGR
jgi:hypothetical protein